VRGDQLGSGRRQRQIFLKTLPMRAENADGYLNASERMVR
jgi:hypothetical protein